MNLPPHLLTYIVTQSNVYIYICIYIYMHTYIHTHTYTYMYVCVYIYIHIRIFSIQKRVFPAHSHSVAIDCYNITNQA